jgi:hypothetical protein
MPANVDFKDLFKIFNAENVEYLVVGAHAVVYYAEPRYTRDLDVWVNPTPENATRVHRALKQYGAPLIGVTIVSFTDPELIYQIGIAPNRIDIMMGIAGVDFSSAWAARVESTYDGIPIHILGKADLIKTKRATGRPQDLLDLERLETHDCPKDSE